MGSVEMSGFQTASQARTSGLVEKKVLALPTADQVSSRLSLLA